MNNLLALLILFSTLLLGGCWDARDIADADIALSGSFDIAKEEDKINPEDRVLVALQVPVVGSDTKEKSFLVESTGITPGNTRSERATRAFRQVEFSEIQSLLFGEDLAREGLEDELDIVFRNPFLNYQVKMAVVEGYARDLLQMETTNIPNIGIGVAFILETITEQNFVPSVTLADFRYDEFSYGRQPVLPVISKWKDKYVQINGLAVFKDGKMVGKFNRLDMKYLTLLRGDKSRGTITFPLKDDIYVTIQGMNSRQVDVELVDGKAYTIIDIYLVTDIVEVTGGYKIHRQTERIEDIARAAETYILAHCQEVLEQLQTTYKVDSLNTGAQARARYGKAIKEIEEDELFANSEVTINVHVKIRNYGATR